MACISIGRPHSRSHQTVREKKDRREQKFSPKYLLLNIYNSNSISLTSKPQQSVSSVGNLQAKKADFEMRAAYI